MHEWTKPGAWFGLQPILRNRVPRDKKDLEDVHWVTHVIFPGGLNPRIEEVVQAVNPYWEIVEMHTPAARLPDAPRTSGAAACAITRRRSARSGATRSSTTTTAT